MRRHDRVAYPERDMHLNVVHAEMGKDKDGIAKAFGSIAEAASARSSLLHWNVFRKHPS